MKQQTKRNVFVAILLAIVSIAAVIIILLMGSVKINYFEKDLEVDGPEFDVKIAYSKIVSVTMIDSLTIGDKKENIETLNVISGVYTNSDYNEYTLHMYKDLQNKFIVINYDVSKYVVFNMKDLETTTSCYNEIIEKITITEG